MQPAHEKALQLQERQHMHFSKNLDGLTANTSLSLLS